MKKSSQRFLLSYVLVSSLTFHASAYAESSDDSSEEEQASSLYDRAFPEVKWPNGTGSGALASLSQAVITTGGLGMRAVMNEENQLKNGIAPAKKAMQTFLDQETRRLAIEDLQRDNHALHKLIVAQEQAQEALNDAQTTIKEINDLHLTEGRNLDRILKKSGDVTYTELVNARSQAQLKIPELERTLAAAKKAAAPAEAEILRIKDGFVDVIKKGNSPEYQKLLSRVRWRNFSNAFFISNYVSAAWRMINALDGRQSGVSPAYSLGSESVKSVWQGLKNVKMPELNFGAAAQAAGKIPADSSVQNGNK